MEIMNLESRKINLINWLSSLQEPAIIDKVEAIQKENADWWDSVSQVDKQAKKKDWNNWTKVNF